MGGGSMPAMGNPPATILIVDDDRSVRDMLQQAFLLHGYQTTAVSTSMEALKLLDAGAAFDLMVIDVLMPAAIPHGLSFGHMVRYRNPNQRLVYMSGAVETIPKAELDAAEVPVLAKPVRVGELLEVVRTALAAA
jgi:two-component system, cell cycle sensor histidine kinase and response regulator CckA